jgi:hypothetical protein
LEFPEKSFSTATGVYTHNHPPIKPATNALIALVAYRLKYVHAASANNTIVAIQRVESLIPVFLAMYHILSPTLH